MRGRSSMPAWELAAESVQEALESGAAPSLAGLGRLGQLGSLPAVIGALRTGVNPAGVAASHARERASLGFAPSEVAGELLALGRVLERRRERAARLRLDAVLVEYVSLVTGELADRARRDPLTGLLNHVAFHSRLTVEVSRARRYRARLALVLFDLDSFKQTNDTRGHREGDRLLRAFAAALASTARESDAVGRIGGDEFAALLLEPKRRSARAFVGRLHERTAGRVGFSAGEAHFPEDCASAEQLLELADSRLYEQKAAKAA